MENLLETVPGLKEYAPDYWDRLGVKGQLSVMEGLLEQKMGLRVNRGDAAPKMSDKRELWLMTETLKMGEAHPGLPVLGTASEDDITYD